MDNNFEVAYFCGALRDIATAIRYERAYSRFGGKWAAMLFNAKVWLIQRILDEKAVERWIERRWVRRDREIARLDRRDRMRLGKAWRKAQQKKLLEESKAIPRRPKG